ncbi:MAG: porin, partial [Rhodospirillales bacterium]|nr:porin [Rhodospirillales bacterium]
MKRVLKASGIALGIISAAVGAAGAQPVEPVAPGTIQVHLNGYLQFLFGTVGGNGMSGGSY